MGSKRDYDIMPSVSVEQLHTVSPLNHASCCTCKTLGISVNTFPLCWTILHTCGITLGFPSYNTVSVSDRYLNELAVLATSGHYFSHKRLLILSSHCLENRPIPSYKVFQSQGLKIKYQHTLINHSY